MFYKIQKGYNIFFNLLKHIFTNVLRGQSNEVFDLQFLFSPVSQSHGSIILGVLHTLKLFAPYSREILSLIGMFLDEYTVVFTNKRSQAEDIYSLFSTKYWEDNKDSVHF